MKITSEWLKAVRTAAGGYSKKQLALIGVAWPPPKGWSKDVVGLVIDDSTAAEVMRLARRDKGAST